MSESILSAARTAGIILAIIIILLWILTIAWVIKDSSQRGASPLKWGIVSIIPFLGAIIYLALRPPLLLSDRQEQEIDYMLRQRELMKYGECGRCNYPVQDDYVMCPNCGARLKSVCLNCGKPLNPDWRACPWCGTRAQHTRQRRTTAHPESANRELTK